LANELATASAEVAVNPLTTSCSFAKNPRSVATIAGKASQPLLYENLTSFHSSPCTDSATHRRAIISTARIAVTVFMAVSPALNPAPFFKTHETSSAS
jgi:hypothetical protein